MNPISDTIILLAAFAIIAVASHTISKQFPKIKLPIITGLIFIGMVSGPYLLKLLPQSTTKDLTFVKEMALAFIAFTAGAELFLKDFRGSIKTIKWITIGQMLFSFVIGTTVVFLLSDYIHFMQNWLWQAKLSVAMLTATIFIASSPASAIAVINEMRAKGAFTKMSIGVTVLKDVLIIILFSGCFAIADVLISNTAFNFMIFVRLFCELLLSLLLGYVYGKIITGLLALRFNLWLKAIIIAILGYSTYLLAHLVAYLGDSYLNIHFYIEPMLICILASFTVVNYSKNRREFHRIIKMLAPLVYVAFYTLTGASVAIDVLKTAWILALVFFFIRILALAAGSYIGGIVSKNTHKYSGIAWMSFVTQAGVAIGLVSVVAAKYPTWGTDFATILIAVIVMSEIVGPPIFKWAILLMKESHTQQKLLHENKLQCAVIVGLEGQSLALAHQLLQHGWKVSITTRSKEKSEQDYNGIEVNYMKNCEAEELERLQIHKADAIVLLNSDEDNLKVCEVAYEQFGTRDIVVRVNDRKYIEPFSEMGALIVEPATVVVSLLDHLVRSPLATSLLLGYEKGQDTVDIEMQNPLFNNVPLRDLRVPEDLIVLATKRNNHTLISTGFTQLHLGDILTVVGSVESIRKFRLQLQYPDDDTMID